MPLRSLEVLLFAAAKERAGPTLRVSVPPAATARDVLAVLAADPRLADIAPRSRLAVARRFAAPDAPIPEGAEVALVPPVGGG